MSQLVVLFVLFFIINLVKSDLYGCGEHKNCKTCIAHNPCGWCETNIIYADGTEGPQCAGKPKDINNPPDDYKPWICPSSFQNSYCPGYFCNNKTFTCDATRDPKGIPFQDCRANCHAPVYLCNKTTKKCFQSPPGTGTSLPLCEKECADVLYTCDKQHFQCVPLKNGEPFSDCIKKCYAPTYNCSETNKTCYQVPPGFGTDLDTCKSECGKPKTPSKQGAPTTPTVQLKYICDELDLTCKQSPKGSDLSTCQQECGNPSNTTPSHLIGNYRGIQVNRNYLRGEWTMKITELEVVIKDPSNKVWATGTIGTYNGELWLTTSSGVYRGIDSSAILPEVNTFTWALGKLKGPAPQTFDDAMRSGVVFTMKKCRNPDNCNWISQFNIAHKLQQMQKRDELAINDPCQNYKDCNSCIKASDYCGWCSVNVQYNVNGKCEIPGKQCVGLNQTKIGAKFCCEGSFSTINCNVPSQPPTSTPPPTTIPPLKPTSPIKPPPPTKPVDLYLCNPASASCFKSTEPGSMPLEQCNTTCNVLPDVPVVLRGRKFRGLMIQKGYTVGEYTVKFSTSTAIVVSPQNVVQTAIVSQTGQYLVLNFENGQKIYTLWQLAGDAVVDFLSWAWGSRGGSPPTSFDSAMTTPGQTSFVFDGCSSLSTVCNFGN